MKTFQDYYNHHAHPALNHFHTLGFEQEVCPDNPVLEKYFCRHFCERFKLGLASVLLCTVTSLLWKIGAFNLVDKIQSGFIGPLKRRLARSTTRTDSNN